MKYTKIILKESLKDYTILKLLLASLTAYLLYEELYVFSVEKPTYTSSAKKLTGLLMCNMHLYTNSASCNGNIVLEPDDYPDITLCPFPSYNLPNLRKYGYMDWMWYAKV